jgi:hypothetical protein
VIPTEPVGSIPRPIALLDALAEWGSDDSRLEPLYDAAVKDTVARFEATGSPFCDDRTTSRDTAFAKIRARVDGTRLASQALGVG